MTRRGARPAAVLTAVVLALATGCGDDEAAPLSGEGEFLHGADGVHTRVGEVLLRDISVDEPADTEYAAGDVVRLRVTLVNEAERPDALVGVRSTVAADTAVLVDADCDGTFESTGSVPLPAAPAVRTPAVEVPDGPEVPYVVGVRLDEPVPSGSSVPVTFVFRNAGATTVQVPVELTGQPLVEDDPGCEPRG